MVNLLKNNKALAIWITIGIIFVSFLVANKTSKKEITLETREYWTNQQIMNMIMQEPMVKEVFITEVNVLYIAVEDDGTPRGGLADYFCETIRDKTRSINTIKIIKAKSYNDPNRDNAYGVLLGESYCK